MEVLVFRTNINSLQDVKNVRPVLSEISTIKDWSVDTEDIDKVLRIVAASTLSEEEITRLINLQGYQCVELVD